MEKPVNKKENGIEKSEKQRIFFINSFSFLAIVVLLTFSFVNVTGKYSLLGIIEFTIAVILIANLVLLWLTRNVLLSAILLLAGLYSMFLILLCTGGIAGTGVYWLFTFPPAAFFLSGRKAAVAWIGLLYISIVVIAYLGMTHFITVYYSLIQIRQLLISHGILSICMYIYQSADIDNKIVEQTEKY